jgi:hypothetical protein
MFSHEQIFDAIQQHKQNKHILQNVLKKIYGDYSKGSIYEYVFSDTIRRIDKYISMLEAQLDNAQSAASSAGKPTSAAPTSAAPAAAASAQAKKLRGKDYAGAHSETGDIVQVLHISLAGTGEHCLRRVRLNGVWYIILDDILDILQLSEEYKQDMLPLEGFDLYEATDENGNSVNMTMLRFEHTGRLLRKLFDYCVKILRNTENRKEMRTMRLTAMFISELHIELAVGVWRSVQQNASEGA